MREIKSRGSQFSKSSEYSHGLSQLNYQYTINGPKESLAISRIYQLDRIVLTHSIVDRSTGIFTRHPQDLNDYLGIRFIKSGWEKHSSGLENVVLKDYTIGIFDLSATSHYDRRERTEGINLFIPRTGVGNNLLPPACMSRVVNAKTGIGKVLLEMIFQIVEQFPYCTDKENRVLIQYFLNAFTDWLSPSELHTERNQYNDWFLSATDFMRSNLSDANLTVEKTAVYCQTSIRTLQKVFHSAGFSFSQYLNDLRLTTAAIKLYQTNLPITTIAFQCGYNNSAYFSKRFKERYRVTPQHYRKKMQQLLWGKRKERNCPLWPNAII